MTDDTIFTLVPSSNRGRYALDDPETGHDLTSGEPIAILLGGQWTLGHVEHGRQRYASDHLISQRVLPGYYFIANDGAVLGTMRLSRKRQLYLIPLHTSHVNHDPENPRAEVEKLCPRCHGKTHPWLPGTPTTERPYGYQAITLARVLQAARAGGLSITQQESGAGLCWRIGNPAGSAPDVLDAITSALHCLRMERLEEQEGNQHG